MASVLLTLMACCIAAAGALLWLQALVSLAIERMQRRRRRQRARQQELERQLMALVHGRSGWRP